MVVVVSSVVVMQGAVLVEVVDLGEALLRCGGFEELNVVLRVIFAMDQLVDLLLAAK